MIKQEELLIKKEQLKKTKAEIILINNQAASELKKALNIAADTSLKDQQEEVAKKDVLLKSEQKLTQVQETALKKAQVSETNSKKSLIDAQKATEAQQQGLLSRQQGLVQRQTIGYDDNRRVKRSEHLSNLAGFAVNSGADGMGGMVSAATHAANSI